LLFASRFNIILSMVPFSQVSKEKTCKGRNTQSSDDTPAVKFQSCKRVLATQPPTDRETRSKKSVAQPHENLTPPDGTQATTDAMGDGPDEGITQGITHSGGHNQNTTEGESFFIIYHVVYCLACLVNAFLLRAIFRWFYPP
jgi:hypothetical protein